MYMVVDPALATAAVDAGLILPDPATALGLPVGFMLGLLGGCAQPSNQSPWDARMDAAQTEEKLLISRPA